MTVSPADSTWPKHRVRRHLTETAQALAALRTPEQVETIERIAGALAMFRGAPWCVWVVGNGGSQAAAQHLTLHLREHNIRAFDLLGDNAWLTARSNDTSYAAATGDTLGLIGHPGDCLLVISGSGDSANILTAVEAAQSGDNPGKVYGLLGKGGGQVLEKCDEAVVIWSDNYGPIEDCHLAVIHAIHAALSGTA